MCSMAGSSRQGMYWPSRSSRSFWAPAGAPAGRSRRPNSTCACQAGHRGREAQRRDVSLGSGWPPGLWKKRRRALSCAVLRSWSSRQPASVTGPLQPSWKPCLRHPAPVVLPIPLVIVVPPRRKMSLLDVLLPLPRLLRQVRAGYVAISVPSSAAGLSETRPCSSVSRVSPSHRIEPYEQDDSRENGTQTYHLYGYLAHHGH